VSFCSDYEALIRLYKIKIYVLKNSKLRQSLTVIYPWLLTKIKMVRFIARGKKRYRNNVTVADIVVVVVGAGNTDLRRSC